MNKNTNVSNCKNPMHNTEPCTKNTSFDINIPNYITGNGYIPYYKLTQAVRKPKVEPFNSFAICVPEKTSIVIKIEGLDDIRLPNKESAYTMSFGVFDNLVSNVTINGNNLKGVYLAFSRTSGSTPTSLPLELCGCKLDNNSEFFSNNDSDKNHIVKFRRTPYSKLEDGVLVVGIVNGIITKTLYDNNNDIIESYIIETNC